MSWLCWVYVYIFHSTMSHTLSRASRARCKSSGAKYEWNFRAHREGGERQPHTKFNYSYVRITPDILYIYLVAARFGRFDAIKAGQRSTGKIDVEQFVCNSGNSAEIKIITFSMLIHMPCSLGAISRALIVKKPLNRFIVLRLIIKQSISLCRQYNTRFSRRTSPTLASIFGYTFNSTF